MSVRTQEMADKIISAIEQGIPLRQFCRENGISKSEVYRWMDDDAEFTGRFARARMVGYDALAEETLEIADDARNDFVERHRASKDGESTTDTVFDAEHVQRSKLRIETRLKLLAKWDPKRYGEKLAIGGADDLPPIKTATDEQLIARIRALQAKLDGVV
jgi:predicted DNA-binding transcriptional regulator AlpA